MTDWIFRADLSAITDSLGTTATLRYANRPYQSTPTHPTLPNTFFDGRLKQPLLIRRDMYGEGRTYGDMEITHGTVVLNNADGALDFMATYAFDSLSFKLWRIDPAALNTELPEFTGVMESVTWEGDVVTITVRDITYLFDRALQPTKFAGNNALPNGLEGDTALKGKPKPICYGSVSNIEPVLVNTSRLIYQFHDKAHHASFLPSDFEVAVFDMRIQLTNSGRNRTLAEMQAGPTSHIVASIDLATNEITFTAPHGFSSGVAYAVHVTSTSGLPGGVVNTQLYYAGTFYQFPSFVSTKCKLYATAAGAIAGTSGLVIDITSAGSGTIDIAENRTPNGNWEGCADASGTYIRLGSTPAGRVTIDIQRTSGNPNMQRWDEILPLIFARVTGLAATLDNRMSTIKWVTGHYWTEEITVFEALRELLRSINATLQAYPTRAGGSPPYLSAQQLTSPSGTPRLTLDQTNIQHGTFKKITPQDTERGIPPWRVSIGVARNFSVMTDSEISGGATPTNLMLGKRDYSWLVQDTPAIQTKFPGAPEFVYPTNWNGYESGTFTPDQYFQGLLSNDSRGMYSLEVAMSELDALLDTTGGLNVPGLLLCDMATVTYPRWQFNAGKSMRVIGYSLDYEEQMAQLILWG